MKKLLTLLVFTVVATATLSLTACGTTVTEVEQAELNQGWYYGYEASPKTGTPEDWIWLEDESAGKSKWIEPPVTEMLDY